MRATHPAEHVLRAYLDEELDWPRATACALHLRRCGRCSAALAEVRGLDQRAGTLLARASSVAWASEARARARRRDIGVPLGAGLLGVAAVVFLYVAQPPSAAAGTRGVKDVCCWDLDGGGRGDDGVFTRVRDGEVVECAIVYDDVDASHSLTAADVVRSAPAAPGCAAPPAAAPPARGPDTNS